MTMLLFHFAASSFSCFFRWTCFFCGCNYQELPTLRVQPHRQLPVKRNSLVQYLALTSLFSAFNLWPFVLFAPFVSGRSRYRIRDPWSDLLLSFQLPGLTLFNNYLALYIKRKSNLNGWIFLIVGKIDHINQIRRLFFTGIFTPSVKYLYYLLFGHLITARGAVR